MQFDSYFRWVFPHLERGRWFLKMAKMIQAYSEIIIFLSSLMKKVIWYIYTDYYGFSYWEKNIWISHEPLISF